MFTTLSIPFTISGTTITLPFSAICTVTDKSFGGEVVIEYQPAIKVLEYVDVERRVHELCSKKLTAEELAHQIYTEVEVSLSPMYLKVLVDVKKSEAHQPVRVWKEGLERVI